MKGFTRECTKFSLCGLNCALCSMCVGGYCPGCGGGEGNQSCRMARCSLEHGGLQFCRDCAEYPCGLYAGFDESDSFVPHSSRERDLARARELGLEAYTAELDAKLDALEELLRGYNDGRHKTLFHTAAYLLPPEDLNAALAEMRGRAELDSAAAKERAAAASELLEQAAARRGLSLKLRKKPKKG